MTKVDKFDIEPSRGPSSTTITKYRANKNLKASNPECRVNGRQKACHALEMRAAVSTEVRPLPQMTLPRITMPTSTSLKVIEMLLTRMLGDEVSLR